MGAVMIMTLLAFFAEPAEANTSAWHTSFNSKCVDADANRINQNGAAIQLWACNGSRQQSWTSHADGTIRVGTNGRCLDADTNTAGRNGTVVQLWQCNGSPQQRWSIINKVVRSGYSGKCLDADLNRINVDGARIQLWDCNGSRQQQFYGLYNSVQSDSCPAYNAAGLWTTSTDFARVRVRTCFHWDKGIVRPVADFQVDWPSTCSAGAPWAVSCSFTELRHRKRLSVYGVHLRLSWTDPSGAGGFQDCGSGPFTTSWPAHSTYTVTCEGGWMPLRHAGEYTIRVTGIEGDVKSDGQGWRSLDDLTKTRRF
ncbi:hypothetical protein FB565_006494 [Actinoplanes lutulentus]|uniref:Ricin-type beta-trefoil lectin protein n=1 Tax=Actinoplanes lutulentus TaxID=1287878 RepID=A0A327ZB44_9ACTN|nr:RICIN domain-containing protein [Actinoplanes lutulentus]MBB2946726.1 hypothetical protein [Actinoplanes lutulentus]RAK35618.1 ricin-type beta-trefoil lectin protein [Actinoplanes lutulentus]